MKTGDEISGGQGVIRSNCAYTLEACGRLFGIGRPAIRAARQQGLKVKRIGKRRFILGKDLIEFIESAKDG